MKKIGKILKKIKIKNIIILILLLIFNAYAWFIYATKASTSISVHVSSWNVEFSIGEEEIVKEILIEVERVYPGMETFEKNITVRNRGEVKAKLDYQITSFKILDETYEISDTVTSTDLENKMKTEYPFKINITKDEEELIAGTGSGTFKVTVEWPFESGDDEKDTLWGNKAYDFYVANPGEKSMKIAVTLSAKQITE